MAEMSVDQLIMRLVGYKANTPVVVEYDDDGVYRVEDIYEVALEHGEVIIRV